MNTFVIETVQVYPKVTYYTVRFTHKPVAEFRDFADRMRSDGFTIKRLREITAFMNQMGNHLGAREAFFRYEGIPPGQAVALPPNVEVDGASDELRRGKVRLYCERLNDSSVILYNGGLKTTRRAEDCPNCMEHITTANRLSAHLRALIRANELGFRSDDTLDVEPDEMLTLP